MFSETRDTELVWKSEVFPKAKKFQIGWKNVKNYDEKLR
jgi:hypothetical protein